MPPTIAVLADTHLPDAPNSAQDACLDWALTTLAQVRPEVVVVAGDVTAAGSIEAARRFRDKLGRSGLSFIITPGNSDLRNQPEAPEILRLLQTEQSHQGDGCLLLTADSSEGRLPDAERHRLQALIDQPTRDTVALVTHCPPETMDADSRAWLEGWLARARVSLLVAAHSHRDNVSRIAATHAHTIRGMDPDKAIGGPPALSLFKPIGGQWQRQDLPFEQGTPQNWDAGERQEFMSLLGISCGQDSLAGLDLAIVQGIACVELRYSAPDIGTPELRRALATWRKSGGRHLSWHLPGLSLNDSSGEPAGADGWASSIAAALDHGADALTMHTPGAPVALMHHGSPLWERFAEMVCGLLAPAATRGVILAVENMHMSAAETPDNRRFGYLPHECLAWMTELRSRLGADAAGMLLDIGHARNNDPFSQDYTLGQWYALVGSELVGYHLHQVHQTPEGMRNHQAITDPFGPLISFSSYFWAWQAGQLNHAPMFLEIPGQQALETSLQTFRDAMA